MSNIAMQGGATGTGTVTLLAPVTSTNRTLTLPDNTGTVISTASTGGVSQTMLAAGVAGNGPAFSAYQSVSQTLSASTNTKLTFTTEEFDTNNCFTSSTFTPTIAGYYQVSGGIQVSSARCDVQVIITKNGSSWKQGGYGTNQAANTVSALVYCNGSTDYIELYGYLSAGQALNASQAQTYFQAAMVRAA